jgi:pimeloyl-ACP methyl ester carboxylesterase
MPAGRFDQHFAEERLRALPNADTALMRRNQEAAARLGRAPLLENPHLHHWLHRIDVPTLLVWGVEDQICPFAAHKRYLAEIRRAELFTLPQSGHALHTERPQEVSERLTAFFDAPRSA